VSDSTGRSAFTRLSLSDSYTDGNSNTNIDTSNNDETDLETFREALAVSGLKGSQSLTSQSSDRNSYRANNSSRSATIRVSSNANNSYEELNAFIDEEYNRHVESRKRVLESSSDVTMDSPTHKRSKHT